MRLDNYLFFFLVSIQAARTIYSMTDFVNNRSVILLSPSLFGLDDSHAVHHLIPHLI